MFLIATNPIPLYYMVAFLQSIVWRPFQSNTKFSIWLLIHGIFLCFIALSPLFLVVAFVIDSWAWYGFSLRENVVLFSVGNPLVTQYVPPTLFSFLSLDLRTKTVGGRLRVMALLLCDVLATGSLMNSTSFSSSKRNLLIALVKSAASGHSNIVRCTYFKATQCHRPSALYHIGVLALIYLLRI